MQVSTTLRRARIPEDESDTRTVRPRLDMSARDVLEIDWEKLAVDNSSVCDTYTGLMLDEEQVKAGRETEEKRMLEFEVYEEVSEARDSGTVTGKFSQCVSFCRELHRVYRVLLTTRLKTHW